MKILIIHAVSSDEALLVTPILRSLKQSEPSPEVHMMVREDLLCLFEVNTNVDKLIHYDRSVRNLRRIVKSAEYNLVIDLQNSAKSRLIYFGFPSKKLHLNRHWFKKWLYVKLKINQLPNKHKIDQYFDLLAHLNVKSDQQGLDFFIPEKDEVEQEWLPASHQNGYIAVAIQASHHTRQLPVNRLIELCDRINKPIVLIGDKKVAELANEVEDFFKRGTEKEEEELEELNKNAIIFNACGKFNLNQSADLIRNASWVFTYHNLMMQIAAAFKKKMFTIWGNTTPHFGTYPYETQFTIFENNRLDCRPCATGGFANCPKGHFKCMNDLTFDFYLPD